MDTTFNRIIHFSKLIKISGRVREFNFRKNNNAGPQVFDVDTADGRGSRLYFRLIKENEEWSMTTKMDLPTWITENQEQIIESLEEGLKEY